MSQRWEAPARTVLQGGHPPAVQSSKLFPARSDESIEAGELEA